MNVFASLHPTIDTELSISRSKPGAVFYRSLNVGMCGITPANAEQARRMAELLIQIAEELEQEANP